MKAEEIVRSLRWCGTGTEEGCDDCAFEPQCDEDAVGCVGGLCDAAADKIEELVDRCARYAEEIAELRERQKWIPVTERLPEGIDMDHEAAETLRQLCRGCDLDRLEELVEADKDERVVALPVKPVLTPIISSMLYTIEDGDIYEDALYEAVVGMSESGKVNVVYTTLSDQIIFEQADIGKTVFLTREEAKKALEAMRKGELT